MTEPCECSWCVSFMAAVAAGRTDDEAIVLANYARATGKPIFEFYS